MRRRKRIESQKKKGRIYGIITKFVTPLLLILFCLIFVKLTTHFWNGHDKFAFVFRDTTGNVQVTVLDPGLSESTTLVIPGDTEVDVAENYGTLRIKNVWQLGINEKKDGRLLTETVMKNFLFPVFLWSGESGVGIGKGQLTDILGFIFNPGQTNISFGDRLQAGLFALRVQGLNRDQIDLGKSQFVTKKILSDGSTGFIISTPISERLTVYFSDPNFSNGDIRVKIDDQTGSFGVADNIGEIIQVMGAKVASIDRAPQASDVDCQVMGTNSDLVKKATNIFKCTKGGGTSDFDLEIILGSKFAGRF